MKVILREARIDDIAAIQHVRNAVRENRLSDPSRVTDQDVRTYLFERGRGWVASVDNEVVGFAIGDLQDANIWALFVLPEAERHGIGRALHDGMVEWMFAQGLDTIWLSTDPGTRAEKFYREAGWKATGLTPNGEMRFELISSDFRRSSRSEAREKLGSTQAQ